MIFKIIKPLQHFFYQLREISGGRYFLEYMEVLSPQERVVCPPGTWQGLSAIRLLELECACSCATACSPRVTQTRKEPVIIACFHNLLITSSVTSIYDVMNLGDNKLRQSNELMRTSSQSSTVIKQSSQGKATKMVRGPEYMVYKERLRELGLLAQRRGPWKDIMTAYN